MWLLLTLGLLQRVMQMGLPAAIQKTLSKPVAKKLRVDAAATVRASRLLHRYCILKLCSDSPHPAAAAAFPRLLY